MCCFEFKKITFLASNDISDWRANFTLPWFSCCIPVIFYLMWWIGYVSY